MKKSIGAILVLVLVASVSLVMYCAAELSGSALYIDTFLTNGMYRIVPSATTNAGETGLSTGTCYACFDVGQIASLSESEAGTNAAGSDIRELIYGIVELFYAQVQAQVSTSRPDNVTVLRSIQSDPNADLTIMHRIDSKISIDTLSIYE